MPDGKYVENLAARQLALDYAFRQFELSDVDTEFSTETVVLAATEFFEFLTTPN